MKEGEELEKVSRKKWNRTVNTRQKGREAERIIQRRRRKEREGE